MSTLRFFAIQILSVLLGCLAVSSRLKAQIPEAPKASLNLSHWQSGSHIQAIQEPWAFYWKTLIEPGQTPPESVEYRQAGQAWSHSFQSDQALHPAKGWATYELTLRQVHPRSDGYQIGMKGAGTAFRLTVYPIGRPEAVQSIVRGNPTPGQFQASRRSAILNLHPTEIMDYRVLLQVANEEYAWGGPYYPVYLSSGQQIQSDFNNEGIISTLGLGIMLAVGIYSFMIWVRRRADRAALMLCITAVGAILRLQSTSPFLVEYIPDAFYTWIIRSEFFSMNVGSTGYLAFLLYTFRRADDPMSPRYVWSYFLIAWNLLLIISAIILPLMVFDKLLIVIQLNVAVSSLTYLILIGHALRQRQPGAMLAFSGCLFIVLGSAYDIVAAIMLLGELYITPWGVMIFLILQSQVVAIRSARAYDQSKRLATELTNKNAQIMDFNRNLEKLVDSKTKEIRALLDHIPQGVCSVASDGRLSRDYSANLLDILEIQDIGGRSFSEVILQRCLLSPDEKDQILQTLATCLGEDKMNFELNSSKLPDEICYQIGNKQKYLKATWNYQLDDNGRIENLLLTFLDITAEKTLESESIEQQMVLEKIKELVAHEPLRVARFFSTGLPLLQENLRILNETDLDSAAIRLLFVNAHTVKGAARTLHLRSLADAIHQAENRYAAVLQGSPIDRQQLQQDCQQALEAFNSYRDINSHKLNRSNDLARITIDREIIMSHYYNLQQFLATPALNVDQLVPFLRAHSENLTQLIFEQLDTVFDAYAEQADKIAKDLGKPKPLVKLDVPRLAVPSEFRVLLDKCMIHILRNGLDHGIEDADERRQKHKPIQGTISITVSHRDWMLLVTIEDDGRGLALNQLKEKALKVGLLTADSTADQVADLIFASGISTAKSISEISGRGIGMDAVRRFLEEAGGSIAIELKDIPTLELGYTAFALHLRIPLRFTPVQKAA